MVDAPFLLLSIRDEDEAADDEFRAVRRFAGLAGHQLHRIKLTERPLGAVDLRDWSGIILGGGPYNVSDDEITKSPTQRRVETELAALLETVIENDFPFLGCCYGIGTVGLAVGAVIDRVYTEPVGPVTVAVTEQGRRDPLFADLPDVFDAYGGHKEAATTLPAGVAHLASSPACPVQAFRVGANVYATQFHPELDLDGLCTRIEVYKNHGYFPPETAEALKQTARQRTVTAPMTILRRFAQRYSRQV
ncbi:glutamine amidotransferase [Mycolicibacterium duvalii]|uniref:Glutamine amidotransferase n=1 Tax=Mycolicibacterium duvalii TaxID=39688 RepID=A0A7I7JWY3_9MYCO|nr:glutamine amidotransferase [Mycolicibacterium duvalii]MCV7369598.1 glutamine amidotransferase [Mycolicibacterium duvalii]PEG42220.1 glutamine amidotransferase [Mycolicibacterium duvalii]BBX16325.1 glutamine amidotransferase [Mycolicibacterium duvalii]